MVRRKKTTRTGKGRKPLSATAIFEAALRLADAHGVDSLSMRKIALSLNVEAMSLYNHVQNKDSVIDGILGLVVSQFELPAIENHWKVSMHQRALSAHQVLLEHPWAAMLMISQVTVNPARLAWTEATIACLHHAGFSYPMADHAWNAIDNHIFGFTLQAVSAPVDQDQYAAAAEHYLPVIPATTYPHLHAMATLISQGEHSGVNDFEFGLRLILDGLERLLDAE